MRRFVKGSLLAPVLLLPTLLAAANPPRRANDAVALVAPPDSKPTLNRQTIVDVLNRTATELRVQDRPMPRIVVIQAGEMEARVAEVRGHARVFVEKRPESGQNVYLAWIVGSALEPQIAMILASILSDEFHLSLSAVDIDKTVRRLYARQNTVIDVQSLLGQK